MIPLHLSLSGFLSYREPVDIDFTSIDLACISGQNGAGKSSLLDAITWVLFGQARKRDESVIHSQANAAEVSLIFAYEGGIYRVQRTLPRGKTSMLEFQISEKSMGSFVRAIKEDGPPAKRYKPWKTLSERSIRETQSRIEAMLSLNYETFVNASFFLQGKADQFTQQRPADRKRILSSILGLDTWEEYRQRAGERRRTVEAEIIAIDASLGDIKRELAEESSRRERLAQTESELVRLSAARAAQETALDSIRKLEALLEERSKQVETMVRRLDGDRKMLSEWEELLGVRKAEKNDYVEKLGKAVEIEAAYTAWQKARSDLEAWESTAARFRDGQNRRQEPLNEINTERARLRQESETLAAQEKDAVEAARNITSLEAQLALAHQALAASEAQWARRAELDGELQAARQRQAEARAENPRLKTDMDELKERIDRLTQAGGAICPLCGQPLLEEDRQRLIAELKQQGALMGNRYRDNQTYLKQADERVASLEKEIRLLAQVEREMKTQTQIVANLSTRIELLNRQREDWLASGRPRLEEVSRVLRDESYAARARACLEEIDAELKLIGYDVSAHEMVRKAEMDGRASEADLRMLENARATLTPLEREIANLEAQVSRQRVEVEREEAELRKAVDEFDQLKKEAPDSYAAELALLQLQQQENQVRMEVGRARQQVEVLKDLKARRTVLEAQRDEQSRQAGRYKQLERAFGKDGVPALLIEQALPEIENRANAILERLSSGGMSVRFVTQAAYKDRRREDLKETLDIQISDSSGIRDYEMYSIDGSEPVYIRKDGLIQCQTVQSLWQEHAPIHTDGEYEFQEANFDALCYENGKVEWLPTESILRHPAPEEMLRFTFAPGQYSVTVTPNHSMLVMTPNGLTMKRGDEIEAGDFVLTPKRIPWHSSRERRLERLDFIRFYFPKGKGPEKVKLGRAIDMV
ncbi:MAG: hypothetical protein EHM41_02090 [Chloroflexi bacterium]|nr:MAG: hypothetical protein EHM41_02090 [Chloroflexota bacterium]